MFLGDLGKGRDDRNAKIYRQHQLALKRKEENRVKRLVWLASKKNQIKRRREKHLSNLGWIRHSQKKALMEERVNRGRSGRPIPRTQAQYNKDLLIRGGAPVKWPNFAISHKQRVKKGLGARKVAETPTFNDQPLMLKGRKGMRHGKRTAAGFLRRF